MGCGTSRVGSTPIVELSSKKLNTTHNDYTANKHCDPLTRNDGEYYKTENVNIERKLMSRERSSSAKSLGGIFSSRKLNIFSSVNIFKKADERALHAPLTLRSSATALVDYLIAEFKHSDLLKLRVLWRWITNNITYDVEKYFNETSLLEIDATNVLFSGKSICSGYSNLFKDLGELAGLKVECVHGWSKGYSFDVNKNVDDSKINHSWNTAYLDNSWWLFDCTWGAGYIDENRNFIQSYNEHFFMTDPNQFIYDHFPIDSKWQLLDLPISMEDYVEMALFTHKFFKLEMRPMTHKKLIIESDTGKIHFKFKIDKELPIKCCGEMTNEKMLKVGGQFLHIYTTEKVLHALVTLPAVGKFVFYLYADRASVSTSLPLVCTYSINCLQKPQSLHIYPKQFKKWSHGFYLISPIEGQLKVNSRYKFKLSVIDAVEMAVCLGGECSHVVYLKNTIGTVWENDVTIVPGVERVTVVGKFEEREYATFSSILEYIV